MNNSILKNLLSRHLPIYENNKFRLSSRIKDDMIFNSTTQAVEYLSLVIDGKAINQDNILPSHSEEKSYIVTINIVDEAICSILHEIFLQVDRHDPEFVEYISFQLSELENKIHKYLDLKDSNAEHFKCLRPLLDLIISIRLLYNKKIDQRFFVTQVAKLYYILMLNMYITIGQEDDEYCIDMANIYDSLLQQDYGVSYI